MCHLISGVQSGITVLFETRSSASNLMRGLQSVFFFIVVISLTLLKKTKEFLFETLA